jgi:CheY-like chemotaxis protein
VTSGALRILIVDDNPDGLYLLSRTLLRCFPRAIVEDCVDLDAAVERVGKQSVSAVVVHRAHGLGGLETVTAIRAANRHVPIVYVSGVERSDEAIIAGATRFLNYDAWLRIGVVVAELIPKRVAPESGTIPMRSGAGDESAGQAVSA